jgi:cyclophilin family peptidyl-prolyl cis-trans isomerase
VIDTFVKLGGQPGFDYVYTVFGQVFEGMDIVEQITSQETDKYNRPKKDITVSTVTISNYSEQ